MYKSLKRIALTFALVLACASLSLFAAACNPENESDKVAYSVTVTTQDTNLSLETLKAQWMSGENAASEEIALDQTGKATAELAAGDYTVTLKGVPEGYTFENASVTAENRDATIEVKVKTPQPQGPEELTGNARIIISVTLPAGVTEFPAGVKAQVYNGTEKVGSAADVDVNSKTATVTVPKSHNQLSVSLEGLPDYLAGTPQTFKPEQNNVDVTVATALQAVNYTITVTNGNLVEAAELDEGKITFYKGEDPVEGATDVAISSGAATVNLLAGDYTVKFTHDDKSLESADATVSITAHTATINVTASVYDITVTKGTGLNVDFTALKVTLTGEGTFTANCGADGIAHVRAPKAAYTVKVAPVANDNSVGSFGVSVSAINTTATVEALTKLQNNTVSEAGKYIVAISTGTDTEYKIAPSSEPHTVRIAIEKEIPADKVVLRDHGGTSVLWETDNGDENGDLQSISFNVGPDEVHNSDNSFKIQYVNVADSWYNIIFNVSYSALARPGESKERPIMAQDGENKAPTGLYNAWFELPTSFGSHQITFSEDYTVTYIDYLNSQRTLENEDYFKRLGTAGQHEYLHVTSVETDITFNLEEKEEPGSNPTVAIDMTLDQWYTHTFDGSNKDWYYHFTPNETAEYAIEYQDGNTSYYVSIFTGEAPIPNGMDNGYTNETYHEQTSLLHFRLTQSQIYCIALGHVNNQTVTFKLKKWIPAVGDDKSNPMQITKVGEEFTDITLASVEKIYYFSHEVTAESLNDSDNVVFQFKDTAGISGVCSTFYSNADFSSVSRAKAADKTVTISGKHAGETIYFTLQSQYSNDNTVSIYINKPVSKNPVIKVGTPLQLTAEPDSYDYHWKATADLDEGVTAGKYEISWTTESALNGTLTFKADNDGVLATVPGSSQTTGKTTIQIIAGYKTLDIDISDCPPTGPMSITFTLNAIIELSVGSPLTVTLKGGDVEVPLSGVQQGTYTIKYENSSAYFGYVYIEAGTKQITISGKSSGLETFELEEGVDKFTIKNMSSENGTVTLTLYEGEVYGKTLKIGEPLEVTAGYALGGEKIGLDAGITPANYTIKITAGNDGTKSFKVYLNGVEDGAVDFSGGEAVITIAAETKYIQIGHMSFGASVPITITIEAGGELAEPDSQGNIELDTPYVLTVAQYGTEKQITLQKGETYHIEIEAMSGDVSQLVVNDINSKLSGLEENHVLTQGVLQGDFTVKGDSGDETVTLKFVDFSFTGGQKIKVTITSKSK